MSWRRPRRGTQELIERQISTGRDIERQNDIDFEVRINYINDYPWAI